MKRRRMGEWVSLFAVATIAAMIFCLSAQGGQESSALSDGVTRAILSLLEPGFSRLSAAEQLVRLEMWGGIVRKLAHFTEFALLGAALAAHLRLRRGKGRLRADILPAWAFATVYAGTDELHQLFVDGRGAALKDVCIDSAGALTGALACLLVFALARNRREKQKNRP